MSNLHPIDRLLRAVLAIALFELAYFWLSGAIQIASYVVGAVLLLTALLKFCPVYRLIGWQTQGAATSKSGALYGAMAVVLLLAEVIGGSYASYFFTRKQFLEDFSAVNEHYKQTLFLTGQGQRERAVEQYDLLIPAYAKFRDKYSAYRPYVLKGDLKLSSDLITVQDILNGVNERVRTGDLQQAHLALEKVRPVFQDIFKRNGFSMLAVALVDFHDAMELMLEAASAKNADKVKALYPDVSSKLQAIEAQSNDATIQTIRKNLDALFGLASSGALDGLPAAASELKSSFVKVYLQRG